MKTCKCVILLWIHGLRETLVKIGRKKRFHSCICNFIAGKYRKSEEKNLPEAQFGSNSGRTFYRNRPLISLFDQVVHTFSVSSHNEYPIVLSYKAFWQPSKSLVSSPDMLVSRVYLQTHLNDGQQETDFLKCIVFLLCLAIQFATQINNILWF